MYAARPTLLATQLQKRLLLPALLIPCMKIILRANVQSLDISEKQCRDAIGRVSTRVVNNAQLISGDVY